MLLAAACCIPAILCHFHFAGHIPDESKARASRQHTRYEYHRRGDAKRNHVTRLFLAVIQVPLFMAILLAILIAGEVNFFSPQVTYQTEPFGNVGE